MRIDEADIGASGRDKRPEPQAARPGLPVLGRRAGGARPLLADHDAGSLAELLVRAGGSPSAARAAAGKVLRHAFGSPAPDEARDEARWDAGALAALGIGAWAHAALLELSHEVSLSIAELAPSTDDTLRLVLRARDGALIEAVLIPGPARTTLCISSQVGCARACAFCETGRLGLERQLRAGEIVDQVRVARALWRQLPPLSNLVFMGMGEPFDNLSEVLRAVRLLTDPRAFGFAPSRVTVSTVGVADRIEAFFAGAKAELAVSLNAPDDTRRGAIMPINARFPMDALKAAISRAMPRGRRLLFEYVLFDGYNDEVEDADRLAAYVSGLRCRVNVIPANPGPDPALRPPRPERLATFVARLSHHGVTTLVRRPRGRDVGGACGQLSGTMRSEPGRSRVG